MVKMIRWTIRITEPNKLCFELYFHETTNNNYNYKPTKEYGSKNLGTREKKSKVSEFLNKTRKL